jgi:dihydroorotate dehydrogenase (fumarate)
MSTTTLTRIDLGTRYLGLPLRNPIVAAASPLTANVESLQRLQDAGVSAVVLPSLFEEQIEHEEMSAHELYLYGSEVSPEAHGFFPEVLRDGGAVDKHLRFIEQAKRALEVPVIASLNGYTPGGWTHYARQFESAGADAIELNVYFLATNPSDTSQAVEQRYLDIVAAVRADCRLPLSVKVAPYFSAFAHMARSLVTAGADGLVLFNRFVQPDILLDELEVAPHLVLSTSDEVRLALRWIAILHGHVKASFAATGGAHTSDDVLKLLLAGADCVMIASSLLQNGPTHVRTLLAGVERWMSEREYVSVQQLKGSLSQRACPDPAAFERANYMKALKSYTSRFE